MENIGECPQCHTYDASLFDYYEELVYFARCRKCANMFCYTRFSSMTLKTNEVRVILQKINAIL